MTRVEDMMTTSVMTIGSDVTLGDAQRQMEVAEVRHLPVLDGRRRVVGMLSDRDVLRGLGRGGHRRDVPVREVMTHDVASVGPETAAWMAAGVLIDQKIGALPVVNEHGELIGIISATDFLAAAQESLKPHHT